MGSIPTRASSLLRNVSRGAGRLDQPDSARKTHPVAVPPSGGCAVFPGLLTGHLFFFAVPTMVWWAAAMVLVTGIADDRRLLLACVDPGRSCVDLEPATGLRRVFSSDPLPLSPQRPIRAVEVFEVAGT